tara:strand:+ start:393 stop:848 length:456 start_codon:yes stop_codon:yes gene_type:complete
MAVAPSAFEAHASRKYVIEEGMETEMQNDSCQRDKQNKQTQRPYASPSIGMLLGINAFGVMGPMSMHPSHFIHDRHLQQPTNGSKNSLEHSLENGSANSLTQSSITNSNDLDSSQQIPRKFSAFKPITPMQNVAGEGEGERDTMLRSGNVV